MPSEIWDKVKNHPCYSEEAHHHFARMHVAVAPACNIQGNYCNRKYDCSNESRPGVVSQKLHLRPGGEEGAAVASEIPQMTVLGIAGPGDALANPKKTFDNGASSTESSARHQAVPVHQWPGPAGDEVDEICKHNIDHVTITTNMSGTLEIGAKIRPVDWNHPAGHPALELPASCMSSR